MLFNNVSLKINELQKQNGEMSSSKNKNENESKETF